MPVTPPEWVYVFTDALTDVELATLPMVGVSFEKVLNGTGKLEGYIPVSDAGVRALDPWTATVPRRTCVYVYYGDLLVWGGMIWQRERSHAIAGLKITAATLDSWLATQFLTADLNLTNLTAPALATAMINQIQSLAGANMRLAVVDASPDRTQEILRTRAWPRINMKTGLDLLGTFLSTQDPIEWRIDPVRNANGTITKQLMIGEPRLGRTTDVTGLYLYHSVSDPGSTLMTFTDLEDGAVQSNAALGTIPDPNGTNQLTQRLWSYHGAVDVGVDELGAGFPLVMRAVSTMDRNVVTQTDLDDAVLGAVYDGLSQGKTLTNFATGVDQLPLGSYDVGDNLDVDITHPAYREFPGTTQLNLRILGRKITPRGPMVSASQDPWTGGTAAVSSMGSSYADKVDLSVWDAGSARLPRSTTLVAHMRDLIRRVKSLEVA